MALDTLDGLRTSIANWLARDNLTAYIDDLILTGEKYVSRRVRCAEMEAAFSDTMASDGTLSVPDGFQSWKWVALTGTPYRFLKVRSASALMETYPLRGSDAKPSVIARDAGNFIFGPFPNSQFTVVGTYYKRPVSILGGMNDLFAANPDLYLFSALAEAVVFLKDDARVSGWISKREAVIQSINQEANDNDDSGTTATVVDFAE